MIYHGGSPVTMETSMVTSSHVVPLVSSNGRLPRDHSDSWSGSPDLGWSKRGEVPHGEMMVSHGDFHGNLQGFWWIVMDVWRIDGMIMICFRHQKPMVWFDRMFTIRTWWWFKEMIVICLPCLAIKKWWSDGIYALAIWKMGGFDWFNHEK